MGHDRSDVSTRHKMIDNFAAWTAVSAARRSGLRVCPAIEKIDFQQVLCNEGSIDKQEFDQWHEAQVQRFGNEAKCSIGWAAKIINVYLKTQCYVGGRGRKGLDEVIHPPFDHVMIRTLKKKYPEFNDLMGGHSRRFSLKGLERYSRYQQIIESLASIARQERCKLIEMGQYWNCCE